MPSFFEIPFQKMTAFRYDVLRKKLYHGPVANGSCIQFPGLIFHVENSAAYREDPGNGPSESLSGTPFVPGMLTWKQSKVWGRARYAR